MKFRTKMDEDTEREQNPAFKQVPELWDFLNHEDSWSKFQILWNQETRQGVPYYCLSQGKKVDVTNYARVMCESGWRRFDDFVGFSSYNESQSGCVLPIVVVCDDCLRAIGVDPSQYDTQDDLDYQLRNETDPDKLMLLGMRDLQESEWKILYFRWHELMIKAGRWTDDWDDYVSPYDLPLSATMESRIQSRYMGAGNTDPDMFARMALGWYEGNGKRIKGRSAFRKWSQEWHSDRNRVTAGRMIERMYWLLGEPNPPKWDQVRSMKACVETVEKMRRQDKEYEIRYRLLDSKTRRRKSRVDDDGYEWAISLASRLSRQGLIESYAGMFVKRYSLDQSGYWKSIFDDRKRGLFVPLRERSMSAEKEEE